MQSPYITVEYNAEGLSNNLTMTIVNIDGKTVKTDKLLYAKDSLNINIKGLSQGSYILNICSEGNIVHSKKFIINNNKQTSSLNIVDAQIGRLQ